MDSSGISGGTLWLVINLVAVIVLGAALAFGVTQWRSRNDPGRAIGDEASRQLSSRPESSQPEVDTTSLKTQRYVVPGLVALGFAFALGMLWWGNQATQADLTQNPPTTSGKSAK